MLSPSMRTSHATLAALPARLRPSLASRAGQVIDLVLTWHERARQRRALLQLSDDMLGDIGISRAQALAEAHKVWWLP
jgi:uncharacterized protein YjiS (DUF1127 family)